jgi:hypothetical protein
VILTLKEVVATGGKNDRMCFVLDLLLLMLLELLCLVSVED